MNEQQVRAFIGTVDAGSIAAASKQLFMTPQALQHQLNSLETELAAKLLTRTRSGCAPTDAGEEFLAWARRTVRDFESVLLRIRMADKREKSTIYSLSSGLLNDPLFEDAVSGFMERHPDINLSVSFAPCADGIPCDVLTNDIVFDTGAFEEINHVNTCCFLVMSPWCDLADLAKEKGSLEIDDLVGYTVLVPREHLTCDSDPEPVARLRRGVCGITTKLFSCFDSAQSNDCMLITDKCVQLNYGPRMIEGHALIQVALSGSSFPFRLFVSRQNTRPIVEEYVEFLAQRYNADWDACQARYVQSVRPDGNVPSEL